MSEPRISPRKEAAPISILEELSDTHQKIIRQIHEWLTNFLADEHQPDIDVQGDTVARSFLPSIDAERRNNVLLLNGERGTGKTTLLLTLLQMWKEALRDDADQTEEQPNFDKKVTSLLATRRVVPLPILDLQPLGKQHSLILQLAGRLYRVVSVLDGSNQRDWSDGSSELSLPKTRWLDFVRAVAIGHEDDPRKRLASSNPEDFAIELETAERRQMNIGRQWSLLVDSLVDRLPQKSVSGLKDGKDPCKVGKDPCFVIPIDDADMNPERGVELIELLRSLWHPRVVFLLTGDSDLLRSLLFNHYKKVCKRLPDAKANHLASDVLGKVIPPGQRWKCVPSELIGFSFLSAKGVLPEALQNKVKAASLESAFPQRWRVLRDLEQTLRARHLDAVETTRVLFVEALRDSFLSSEEQARLLKRCFRRTGSGKGLEVNENVVRMRSVPSERHTLTLYANPRLSCSWSVSSEDRWVLGRENVRNAEQEDTEDLPDELIDALYLAASCASEPSEKHGPVHLRSGRSLSPRDHNLISSTFGFDRINYDFPWPMPDWHDPIAFRLFAQDWRDVVASLVGILPSTSRSNEVSEKQQDALEVLAEYWITALCEFGESGSIPKKLPVAPASDDARKARWQSLGRRIAGLAQSTDSPGAQRRAMIDWAQTDAMFFASKESSLRLPTRDALTVGWLEAMCPLIAGEVKDERYWTLVGQVMAGRIQRIQRASAGQGPIAEQINRAKLHIRAQSFKHIFANDVTDDKLVPNGLFQIYQLTDPIAIISLSIDGMQPYASGLLERQEPFSYLFPGQYITESNQQEHFRIQVRLLLSKINLNYLPPGLDGLWSNLWNRIGSHFDVILTNMAAKSSLLSDVMNLDAKDANRKILRRYVEMTMPSLAAGLEGLEDEMNRVEELPGRYPTPSVTSREEFKTLLPVENPAFFSLHVPTLAYEFGVSESLFKDHSKMNTSTALGLLSTLRDIVVDQEDITITAEAAPTLESLYLVQYQGINYIIPAPNWLCHYDNQLLLLTFDQLGSAIAKMEMRNQPQVWMSGFLLSSVLLIRDKRSSNFHQNYLDKLEKLGAVDTPTGATLDADERFWIAHRKLVRAFYDPPLSGHRAAVVREWANLAGPLFAAPETGMPSSAASKWLQAWDETDNSIENPEVRKRLSDFRLKRAQASIGTEATMEQARERLRKVDDGNPDHAWVRLVERR